MSQNDEVMALVGELRRAVSGDEVGLILKRLMLLVFPAEAEKRFDAMQKTAAPAEYFVLVSDPNHIVLGVSENKKTGSLRTLSLEKAEALIGQLAEAVAAAKALP